MHSTDSTPSAFDTSHSSTASPGAWFHGRVVHERRVDVLANHLTELIRPDANVLDVGCGDGMLAALIANRRIDLSICGIDVLVRGETVIPVEQFDGQSIPYEDDRFDTVTLVDVVHHTDYQEQLLREVSRVARHQVIIKDHYLQGFAAQRTLEMMDHVGNARHGVDIPCNYLTPARWNELYGLAGLRPVQCRESLGLYPPPLSWLFERSLHFIAVLEHIDR